MICFEIIKIHFSFKLKISRQSLYIQDKLHFKSLHFVYSEKQVDLYGYCIELL
ncbi:hypothetical protein C8C85_0011 [Flavobacterium sp. 103]|nr:hypothetical protein C8C85_0011 [Flavobacterium sp. 103]